MRELAVVIVGAALLAGCEKPPPESLCHAPVLASGAPAGFGTEKQAAVNCVKQAAYTLTLKGGPIAPIADAAMAQCADLENAIGKKSGETLYDYQRTGLHDSLRHTAQLTATQSRALGCGLPPGTQPDTL